MSVGSLAKAVDRQTGRQTDRQTDTHEMASHDSFGKPAAERLNQSGF